MAVSFCQWPLEHKKLLLLRVLIATHGQKDFLLSRSMFHTQDQDHIWNHVFGFLSFKMELEKKTAKRDMTNERTQ